MTSYSAELERFRLYLKSTEPELPTNFFRRPSRSRPGEISYHYIIDGTTISVSQNMPMYPETKKLMKNAAYAFYVSNIMYESLDNYSWSLLDLEYTGEIESTLYRYVKEEMKNDRYLSDEVKNSRFESWVQKRNEERCIAVPPSESVSGSVESIEEVDLGSIAAAAAPVEPEVTGYFEKNESDSSDSE